MNRGVNESLFLCKSISVQKFFLRKKHKIVRLNNSLWRGFKFSCGFLVRVLPKILDELKKWRLTLVIVCETGWELLPAKERLPAELIEYPENEVGPTTRT